VEEPIQVRYDWGAEREVALPQIAPVLMGELMPPAWLQYLVPLAYFALLVAGFGFGGPWVGLGLILAPVVLGLVLLARRLLTRRDHAPVSPLPEAPGEPWVFVIDDSRIEWRCGEQVFQAAGWDEVVRCHRAPTGFVLCFAPRSTLQPVWLPNHAFGDPAQVGRFEEMAKRKARRFTPK
jgi:hypothetical protein